MAKRIIKLPAKNGVVYIYEDFSYWDKEKGYSTHERKCIGKIGEDGQYTYNEYYRTREKMENLERKAERTPSVSKTTLVGQSLLLDKIEKQTKVGKALVPAFGGKDATAILALAYYMICRGKALCRAQPWLDDRGFGDLGLCSQRISELLGRIDDDKVNAFFLRWLGMQAKGRSLLFDITSISTYGKDNRYAERGYNRDHENLEQVNLSLLSSCFSGLPLWYSVMPGSMSDRIVLDYVLEMLKKLGIPSFTFVGDRGFYSDSNLKNLADRGHKFTVPVPSSVSWQKKMIKENRDELRKPENAIDDEGTIIYGKTLYRITGYGRTWHHLYYDPARKEKVIAAFMMRLKKCRDELDSDKPVESHQKMYDTYFTIRDTPKRGRRVSYNDEAIDGYVNNDSCYWRLTSTSAKTASEALLQYRKRNDVELCFDDMKNMLDLKRLRNHNERTVKGKVFVNFVSLIILSQLRRTVSDIPEKEKHYWSEHDMLDKVDSYARIHFTGKYKDVYTTPTASQRKVFDLLGIKYQFKGKNHNADKTNGTDSD